MALLREAIKPNPFACTHQHVTLSHPPLYSSIHSFIYVSFPTRIFWGPGVVSTCSLSPWHPAQSLAHSRASMCVH